jgi:MSHA biogenesis protein MshO
MTNITKATAKGFTLVELVTVIIVLGVVSVGISGFIRTGVQTYSDVIERDQLLGDSRFVVERIHRELRLAIPNSARVTANNAGNILYRQRPA